MSDTEWTHTAAGTLRRWLVTGMALSVPLIATVVVVALALDFVSGVLDPVVAAVRFAPGVSPLVEGLVVQVLTVLVLAVFVLAVGAVATVTERNYAETFHALSRRSPASASCTGASGA